MTDNLTFTNNQYYINITNFKEKDVNILIRMFWESPFISQLLSFDSYGIVNFPDSQHKVWDIKTSDTFNKKSTNILIFNVKEDEHNNPYKYDKLVIYQNSTKNIESFGYTWIRTEDDHTSTHSYLEYLKDNIIKELNKDITTWHNYYIYKILYFTSNKKDKITFEDSEKIYKKYIEEYRWAGTYDEWKNSFKSKNQQYQIYLTY